MDIKRHIAAALAVTIAFCGGYTAFPFEADTAIVSHAASVVEKGAVSQNIKWALDSEGTLTFTGKGDMPDYDFLDGYGFVNNMSPFANDPYIWDRDTYDGIGKNVVISEGITRLGNGFFA